MSATATATAPATAGAAAAAAAVSIPEVDLKGTYRAWVVEAAGKPLVAKAMPHVAPADNEVLIRIAASGICYSDTDAMSGRYPGFTFPLVPGHEGVGTVVLAGKLVPQTLKPGTRVGVGCFRGACHSCKTCTTGHDNLCAHREFTFALGAHGTFAEFVRIKYQFAIPIPDALAALDFDAIGPLFCAGATVFAPFPVQGIKAGSKVAVLGVGGLGHLALQIANKWGCEVTALSSDKSKKEQLLALGAHKFVDTKADPELKSVANTFDHLLLTVSSGALPWKGMLDALAPGGKLVLLGLPEGTIPLDPVSLIFGQKSVVGSAAGSTGSYHELVHFAALHKIVPTVEKFNFDDINTAVARVKAGTLRYRAVVNFTTPKGTSVAAATVATAAATAAAAKK